MAVATVLHSFGSL